MISDSELFKRGPGALAQWLYPGAFANTRILYRPQFVPSNSLLVARGSSTLETMHPCGRPGRSSWLEISPALTVETMWGESQQMKYLFVFPSLSVILTFKQKNKFKKKTAHEVQDIALPTAETQQSADKPQGKRTNSRTLEVKGISCTQMPGRYHPVSLATLDCHKTSPCQRCLRAKLLVK